MNIPDPRPRNDDELGFRRATMARWLSPLLLLHAAVRVVVSGVFGAYLDKREVMAALPEGKPEDLSAEPELWIDYVSDSGDGFDSTYAIATLVSQPTLDLRQAADDLAVSTPRGRVLVMGGDQCYPTASAAGYEDKLVGPYRAALPWSKDDKSPSLYAIPGNHDWYDGLTSFLRVFAQGAWIGGRRTQQTRSYFAIELPHRWWLWGIDVQFNTYVDDPQRRYFSDMAKRLQPGDGVILCTATPAWVNCNRDDPEAFAVLDWFDRTIIQPTGARVQLWLSGDSHHYVHYAEVEGDRHCFTAGGAGAFLSATHHLPERLVVPPAESRARHKTSPSARYAQVESFPDPKDSKRLARGVGILPWRNRGFATLMAAVQAVVAVALWTSLAPVGGIRHADFPTLMSGLVRSLPAVLVVLAVWGALVGFTKCGRTFKGIVAGTLHAAIQLTLAVGLTACAVVIARDADGTWLLAAVVGIDAVIGGILGSEVFAAYLYFGDKFAGLNTNELFSAMSIPDRKNFLRLHLQTDGAITVFPVGVKTVPRHWQYTPDADVEAPWLAPVEPLTPVLLEPPVRVAPPVKPHVPMPRPSVEERAEAPS